MRCLGLRQVERGFRFGTSYTVGDKPMGSLKAFDGRNALGAELAIFLELRRSASQIQCVLNLSSAHCQSWRGIDGLTGPVRRRIVWPQLRLTLGAVRRVDRDLTACGVTRLYGRANRT